VGEGEAEGAGEGRGRGRGGGFDPQFVQQYVYLLDVIDATYIYVKYLYRWPNILILQGDWLPLFKIYIFILEES